MQIQNSLFRKYNIPVKLSSLCAEQSMHLDYTTTDVQSRPTDWKHGKDLRFLKIKSPRSWEKGFGLTQNCFKLTISLPMGVTEPRRDFVVITQHVNIHTHIRAFLR